MITSLIVIDIILNLIILLILCWVAMDTDELFSIKKELKIINRRMMYEQRKSRENGTENSGCM